MGSWILPVKLTVTHPVPSSLIRSPHPPPGTPITNQMHLHARTRAPYFNLLILFVVFLLPPFTEPRIRSRRPFSRLKTHRTIFPLVFQFFCFCVHNPYPPRHSRLSRYSDWLRAGRSGIESRWGRDFLPVQTGPWAHPASCTMSTGSFPGGRGGRGAGMTPTPF